MDTTRQAAGRGYAALVAGRRTKWVVVVFWLLLIGVGGSLATKIGSVQNNDAQTWLPANAESTQALKIADQHFTDMNLSTAVVVYARHSGLTGADLRAIAADRSRLTREHIAAAVIPAPVVSGDKQAAFINVPLRSSATNQSVLGDAVDRVHEIARDGAPAGLNIQIAGEAGQASDFIHAFSGLDTTLLVAAIGVVALLLLITYRSPVLWLVPLLSVGLASEIASAVVYLLARHAGLLVNGESASILTVLVLGVGTDYALLLIARYREELHRHDDRHEAMSYALRRCLPAIAASAATVVIATLCLVFGSMNSTRGLGPVAAIGVLTAFLAMTSLLPALLVIIGRGAFWPFVPRYRPGRQTASIEAEHGLWSRVARAVGRSPRPIWIGTTLMLAGLAFGSITLTAGQTQADQFTKTVGSVTGQQLLDQHFPAGSSSPADVYAPAAQAGTTLAVVERVPGVTASRATASSGGWTHITAVLSAAPDTGAAQQTVLRMRSALHRAGDDAALVGGQSAVDLDTGNAESAEEILLIPLILGVVLIMLILLLRALVAPVILLLSVVLSYGAALGTAALLYRALGHSHVDRGLILFGFIFLVALGVDYTIFLMTRAREEVQRHGHRDGILSGLTVTGGVITSAGLVLAATFSVLAVLPVVDSLQEGLLIAVGVLLDTFLVRTLLIPALSLDVGPRIWRPSHPEIGSSSTAPHRQSVQRSEGFAMTPPTDAVHNPASEPETADVDRKARQSATDAGPVVETGGLTKRYGSRTVVDRLDMQVPAGVVAGFIGPNGAGKTTTLRMLLGLVRPSAGGGRVLGLPLDAAAGYLPCVGALIESPAFYPGLSGERNLAVQATLGGCDLTRVPVVLDRVGLAERGDDPYRTYSLGMKQRLGIAGALLGDPTLLILDEPTNGLDPAGIRDMRGLVRSLAEDGPTVLVSSHLLAEVQEMCDWLVVIEHGRRVFQGPTARLLAGGGNLILGPEHLADLPQLQALLARRGMSSTIGGDRVHADLADVAAIQAAGGLTRLLAEINRSAMAEHLTLVELTVTHASLEDRYLSLTAEPANEGAR